MVFFDKGVGKGKHDHEAGSSHMSVRPLTKGFALVLAPRDGRAAAPQDRQYIPVHHAQCRGE